MQQDLENPQFTLPPMTTPPRRSFGHTLPPDLGVSPTLSTLSAGTDSRVTIEHKVKSVAGGNNTVGSRAVGAAFFMTKPVAVALLGLTVVGSMGGAAFLNFFQVPGLKSQIQELEGEVHRLQSHIDRLAVEVDTLSEENDRYASLNQQLNMTASEFHELNGQLNSSAIRFENLNDQLNASNVVLSHLNQQLSDQIDVYTNVNSELNQTAQELSTLNEELSTVVSFLDETSSNIQQSFDVMVTYLANQIVISQQILMETLHSQYLQQTQTWDCDYRDYFLGEAFLMDANRPIHNNGTDSQLVVEVLDYVDQRALSQLCLDRQDFEIYLVNTNGWETLSSNDIVRSVNRYLATAMRYYFPNRVNGAGLQADDWANANYQCGDLSNPFVYEDFTTA